MSEALPSGSTFGQYRIVRLLGRGGMGEVYEAVHTTLEKRYALKLLPAEFTHRLGALEQFKREAKVMAGLEHPNIVKVDDFGETEERYWLRMELAAGIEVKGTPCITLGDYAHAMGGQIPADKLLPMLKQIVEGLQSAHDKGAVHRDLKPSNILLNQNGAKISDFGLVKVMGEEWLRTQVEQSVRLSMSMGDQPTEMGDGTSTRSMLGTYEYMSPEQKRGEDADEKSDIYAIGLMTYRLLTGRGLGMKRPSQIVDGLPKAWDELVADAIEELKAERTGNCRILLEQLAAIKGKSDPKPAQKETPPPSPRPAEKTPKNEFDDVFKDVFGSFGSRETPPPITSSPTNVPIEKPVSQEVRSRHPAHQQPKAKLHMTPSGEPPEVKPSRGKTFFKLCLIFLVPFLLYVFYVFNQKPVTDRAYPAKKPVRSHWETYPVDRRYMEAPTLAPDDPAGK